MASKTESLKRRITPKQAQTAFYIDFEGTKAEPAQLLGVLAPGGEFTQFVLDPGLESASEAKAKTAGTGDDWCHCQTATLTEVIEDIAGQLDAETVVIAWSRHEYDVINKRVPEGPGKSKVLKACRNAIATARAWKRRHHPDVTWERVPGQGTHHLDRYMRLVGYKVPMGAGGGNTGSRLRYLRDQLEARGAYDAVTPVTKRKWVGVLKHNYHDCYGMREVVVACTADLRAKN